MNWLKKDKLIPLLIIASLIIGGMIWNTWKKNDLDQHQMTTNGKITDFYFVPGKIRYYRLIYKYNVDQTVYEGSESIEYFECEKGNESIKGCLGETFPVYYSSQNPDNSIIDLGKFNSKKHKSMSLPLQSD